MHAVLSGRKSLMVCYSRGNQAMEVTTVVNRFFFFCKETTVKTKPSLSEIIQSAFPTPGGGPAYKIPVSAFSSEGLNGDNR